MLKTSPLVRVTVLAGVLSLIACGKAPFSIPETEQSSLHISPSGSTITAGTNIQLHVSIQEGSSRDLGSGEVRWTSSAPGTAIVDGNGLVVGVAAGQATITAEFGGDKAISIVGVVDGNDGPDCVASQQVPIHCPILSR
jgi:hypothetical protein